MSEWDDARGRLDDFLRVRGGTIPAQAEADIRSALEEIERLTAGYHRRGNELDEQYQEILTRGKRAEAAAAKLAEAQREVKVWQSAAAINLNASKVHKAEVERLKRGGLCCVQTYERAITAEAKLAEAQEEIRRLRRGGECRHGGRQAGETSCPDCRGGGA